MSPDNQSTVVLKKYKIWRNPVANGTVSTLNELNQLGILLIVVRGRSNNRKWSDDLDDVLRFPNDHNIFFWKFTLEYCREWPWNDLLALRGPLLSSSNSCPPTCCVQESEELWFYWLKEVCQSKENSHRHFDEPKKPEKIKSCIFKKINGGEGQKAFFYK